MSNIEKLREKQGEELVVVPEKPLQSPEGLVVEGGALCSSQHSLLPAAEWLRRPSRPSPPLGAAHLVLAPLHAGRWPQVTLEEEGTGHY